MASGEKHPKASSAVLAAGYHGVSLERMSEVGLLTWDDVWRIA